MSTTGSELRPTGPMENWSVSRHLEDFYYGVTSFVKLSSPSLQLSRESIYGRIVEAVETTFWSNFNLRTTIDFPAAKMCYLSPGSAKVDFTWYERSEDTSVELALESEVNKKFPENDDQPLWRVWAVAADADGEFNTFELGITVHHAVADGLSSSNIVHTLTRAFLAGKREPLSVSQDPITIPYDPETDTKVTELSSSIHTILPNCKPPISVLLKEAATKLLLPKFLRPKEVYWSGTKTLDLDTIQRISAKPRQYPTKLLTMTVPLDSLVQKCKQHNTTVHAALATAFILATHVLKPQHPMKFATPINLRPYCEPVLPRESIGVYVSELMTTHPPPQASDIENFWPMAVQFKEQMNASLESAIYTIGLMEYIPNFREFLHTERVASAQNNGHKGSLEISNLGRQDWKDLPESPFHVDELGFAQSANIMGPVFTVSAVTWKNSCKLILSYLLDANEDEDVRRYWAEFQSILSSL
ncbi:CoA-dependent acyltransferase [Basidiobolus meristosporus CBS 931.73]|uniref:CoA-dependent acyltransferase n=1 Tax=Basidiobolus meristosporus CBS 931.73 TaxID=1314790 RepID=A0A1Y1Y1D6_9FUNG|nr:CoA-dependent acyltransferase [Basidiobolus meristosporus CBS 931.73]|eukprot:ORX91820.1 CoA-dependent acyltransferase [Basidiobolus meristosporus CBS 931.73]